MFYATVDFLSALLNLCTLRARRRHLDALFPITVSTNKICCSSIVGENYV
jgi:hypothetical protein